MDNFIKVLQTNEHTYYVDLEECDDNGNTKIYDNEGLLLSDNIHASNSFMDDMEKVISGEKVALYVNEKVLENVRMYLEQE